MTKGRGKAALIAYAAYLVSMPTVAQSQEAPAAEREPCGKPDLPNRTITAAELNGIMQRSQVYVECMQKAIEVARVDAETKLAAAKTQAEKSNKMVGDVNTFVKDVQAYQAEHQGN